MSVGARSDKNLNTGDGFLFLPEAVNVFYQLNPKLSACSLVENAGF